MKKLLLALLFICSPALAATYHACDCSTESHASCVAGDDARSAATAQNPATPWKLMSKMWTQARSMSVGDQFLFCKGGAWAAAAGFSFNSASQVFAQSNNVIFGSYTPSWGGTARPILRISAGSSGFNASSGVQHMGILIRDLELRGTATPDGVTVHVGSAVSTIDGGKYWFIDNMVLDGFGRGVNISGDSYNIVIRNSTIKNNSHAAVYASRDNVLIENNILDNNGSCAVDEGNLSKCAAAGGGGHAYNHHSIYSGGGDNIVVRGNSITKNVQNAVAYPGRCTGPIITGHGLINNLVWENNYLYETNPGPGCDGMGFGDQGEGEGVTFLTIRGNTVVGVGNNSVGAGAVVNMVIENNVIVGSSGFSTAINVGARNYGTSLNTTNTTVRNNSVYTSGVGGSAIYFATNTGSTNKVSNNLVYIASGTTSCWNKNAQTAGNFTVWDYNICYNAGSGGTGGANTPFTGNQTNPVGAQTSSPSLRNTPASGNNYDMCVQAGSTAINAGSTTYKSRLAVKGYPAVGARDIGACEYGSNP